MSRSFVPPFFSYAACRVLFRVRPAGLPRPSTRRSQENQVLNEELTGAAKYFNTVAKLDRARRREQEARREQERDDGPQAPHERRPRRNGSQCQKQCNKKFGNANEMETPCLLRMRYNPRHQRAVGDERLNAIGLGRREFRIPIRSKITTSP